MLNLYEILEVSPNASMAVIRAAYESLANQYHPDRHPNNPKAADIFRAIQFAYEELSDPERRRRYDEGLAALSGLAPHQPAPPPAAPPATPLSRLVMWSAHLERIIRQADSLAGVFLVIALLIGIGIIVALNPSRPTTAPATTQANADNSAATPGAVILYPDNYAASAAAIYAAPYPDNYAASPHAGDFTAQPDWDNSAALPYPDKMIIRPPTVKDSKLPPRDAMPVPDQTPSSPAFNGRILPMPETGVMQPTKGFLTDSMSAPLSVEVPAGTDNYYIKLDDWNAGPKAPAIMVLFVRAGETVTADVPLGIYRLKYAYGPHWYGKKRLFGPQTGYARAEAQMGFRIEGDQRLGHHVELIERVGGNLQTTPIRSEEF